MKKPKKLVPPEPVQKIVDQYKKHPREKYNISPVRVLKNGKVYYCIDFLKPERYLVVTEEGEVPPLHEVKPVINIVYRKSGSHQGVDMTRSSRYWYKRKIKVHQKLLQLLEELETKMNFEDSMAVYIKDFKEACRVTCDRYKKVLENYPVAEKELNDIINKQLVTGEQAIKIQKIKEQLDIWRFEVNVAHLDTGGARMLFVDKLKKQIPVFRMDLWIKYFQLRNLYKQMYNNVRILENFKHYLLQARAKQKLDAIRIDYHPPGVLEIFRKTLNK